jgi:hypothetical protein
VSTDFSVWDEQGHYKPPSVYWNPVFNHFVNLFLPKNKGLRSLFSGVSLMVLSYIMINVVFT